MPPHFTKVLDATAPMPQPAQRRQVGALSAPGLMSLGARCQVRAMALKAARRELLACFGYNSLRIVAAHRRTRSAAP
jgi:hypothetical protein